jgi:hypothetical protein
MDTVFCETPKHIEEIRNPRATSTSRSAIDLAMERLIDVRNSAVMIGLPGLASAAQACHRKAAALAANPDQAAAALPAMAASLSRELRRAEAEWIAARPAFVRPAAAHEGPGMPCGPEPAAGLGVAFKPHGAVAVRR